MRDTQEQVLSFVREMISRGSRPPTYQEIATALGVASRSTIKRHIDELVKDGRIKRRKYGHRCLTLATHCPMCGRERAP